MRLALLIGGYISGWTNLGMGNPVTNIYIQIIRNYGANLRWGGKTSDIFKYLSKGNKIMDSDHRVNGEVVAF